MATWGKIPRCLSYYNTTTQGWEIFPRVAQKQVKPTLTLASWNINYFSALPAERARLILDRVLQGPNTPDIIFFQEVHRKARTSILDDPKVRRAFFATDAEDETSFTGVKFTTMTLLSREGFASSFDSHNGVEGPEWQDQKPLIGRVERVKLPSAYRRDALSVDVLKSTTTGTFLRLINVHLDSLPDFWRNRVRQMDVLTNYLREPGCVHGIIAGDFNAVRPEDEKLVDKKKGMLDAWEELHGTAGPNGHIWGVGAERREGLQRRRLERVVMMGLTPKDIEVLRPGSIRVSEPDREISIPWSDHCGLKCTFAIEQD
jgi:tyrosyl-DNA phosphodiesterase 2